MLKQSYNHLFEPIVHPQQSCYHNVISITNLLFTLKKYLTATEIAEIKAAFQFSDETHLGQYRQSGEPYITHPIAVAELCANWHLDTQVIIAALLHDVIEDQGISKSELAQRFGNKVAELVDGLSNFDRIESLSSAEIRAENFRKMMLATVRDVRVIIVKLADRLHNMRTLNSVSSEKRRRVARETLDIYVPIAQRLGLKNIYRELQELGFQKLYPMRYLILNKAFKKVIYDHKEIIKKIIESVEQAINSSVINAKITKLERNLFSIYQKMREKQLVFSQISDFYSFRVIVNEVLHCYTLLGILHSIYKPVPGKFKDYIAIGKINGYQSLHTTIVGPFGVPIEFQICTSYMQEIAESGIVAYWMFNKSKNNNHFYNKCRLTNQWVKSLLDMQSEADNSTEFFENVKIDLFPDAVYVFTPNAEIMQLPYGATALDFAYTLHKELGNQCIAVKINNELLPLSTELKNGDIIKIITSPYLQIHPIWLSFVRTGKARSAIRYYLKKSCFNELIKFGEQILEKTLKSYGLTISIISNPTIWDKLSRWIGNKSYKEIFIDIALGKCYAATIAKYIKNLSNKEKI